MKLMCTTCVEDRLHAVSSGSKGRQFFRKSTVALCKNRNSTDCIKFYLLLFTNNDKVGTKYNLKNNILQIHSRFVSEGKLTIEFKEPQHNLFIKADNPITLKYFHTMIETDLDEKKKKLYSLGVTPIKQKDFPLKVLKITRASGYPVKCLPKTLETLHINDVEICLVTRDIFQLCRLRVLDLSQNCIEFLPVEMKFMKCLSKLNLSDNQFGKSSPSQWNWIGGHLSKNLKILNLSNNNLTYLPSTISKLHSLNVLIVKDNELKSLPWGIGNLKCLKTLIISNNSIKSFPGNMKNLHLDYIDISKNEFVFKNLQNDVNSVVKVLPAPSLKELSARKLISLNISYTPDMLPLTICDYLDMAKFCTCGRACFENFIERNSTIHLQSIANEVTLSRGQGITAPIEYYCCSLKCNNSIKRPHYQRMPII